MEMKQDYCHSSKLWARSISAYGRDMICSQNIPAKGAFVKGFVTSM